MPTTIPIGAVMEALLMEILLIELSLIKYVPNKRVTDIITYIIFYRKHNLMKIRRWIDKYY
ncbi:hypothetical protein MICCA_980022 [Microcystis aeruginosa PCC 9432]|uniref:Uncharacterized protein n=2 Tax=Microcystis aeruginosa TaxID=1126 RepID=A0A831EI87_MICAE|nr:hypothetical protein BFG60_3814 [Microcystis aeruginosa NIES-98]TRU01270.1 MAG: hypothetical protein EWV62_02410 [Microcystis aeruginosa Ma_OC_LR_19540900_S633]TRU15337.1 MAG: hypothetical protein EWV60_01165 [Microcystis sp. Msp_OC_L_20101000_S702]TYT69839.1 hypothetical protein FXO09_18545 [Microcystis aeruginosa KLA2]CCH95730.1 hypothetical protein MICCA_980022 [Microcystis aeruginosa PCC 9432]CCI29543.1 hypothetical protein MICAG_860017 [Microcystis aeruginosa PCC 9808]